MPGTRINKDTSKNKQTYQKLNNNANIQSPNRSNIEFDKKPLHKRSTNDYTKTSKYTSRKFKTLSHMRRKNLASKINKAAQRKQKYLRAGLPDEAFRLNLKSNTKMPISEASSEDELTQNSSSDQSQTNLFKAGGKTNGIDQQPQSKRAKKLLSKNYGPAKVEPLSQNVTIKRKINDNS